MSKKQANPQQFEQMIAELETIVQQLEQGDLSLDDALAQFERGIALTRASQQQLQAAEQKVQILLQPDAQEQLAPFANSTGD
ncbi:MAG: exodeoxyribonuclease VII small subunit [Gammaproteobacteria bacterium]|jgi:exodeoxyribonuclease VII small subunit|nr:exodeoxyribonuclease VII small subunit [Gammaproteobacteria bacterium]MBU2178577.1 exodeoxyribonuclease VII small subunit [Gammaproteobacteria bacterium]MBU2225589.1 exodeoxyribonuclease VII small subunit [Gammaproteobacteria bacterium]MBU2278943.1 exodeoxyribonuclease VII small subunit [Gammaproteobacteria bacterium]MBU2427630.1 exodeoxyribonuclease VII small subunit [Gammaproteobacteria bacterium]